MLYINGYFFLTGPGKQYQWSRFVDVTGVTTSDVITSVATDPNTKDVYISGYYGSGTQTTIRDESVNQIISLPVSSGLGGFLTKFSSSGVYQWSRIIDSTGNEQALGVACDSSGNIYVCGFYQGLVNIKNDSGTILATLPNMTTMFIIKFDTNGNYQFARLLQDNSNGRAFSIACDSSGNVCVCGRYASGITIRDENNTVLGTIVAPTGTAGTFAALVSKFSSSGVYQWTRMVDGDYEESFDVACDLNNNVYIAGYYTGTPTIKNQTGGSLGTLPAAANGAAFLSKFDSNGNYQWSRIVDSTGNDHGRGVACDLNNNVYIGGFYRGNGIIKDQTGATLSTIAPSGQIAAFLSKFDTNGVPQWTRSIDSVSDEYGYGVECLNNNVYMVGTLSNASTFVKTESNVIIGTILNIQSGGFVCKIKSNGDYVLSRVFRSVGFDVGNGIACDSDENLYLSFYSIGNALIADGQNTYGTIPPALVGQAGYILKLDNNANYSTNTGSLIWTRIIDSTVAEQGNGVACDSSGNVYLGGYYSSNPTIESDTGVSLGTLPGTTGSTVAFVSKFDSNGVYQWSRVVDSAGTSGSDQGLGVTCDTIGNVYLSGFYTGTPTIKNQTGGSLGTLPASTSTTNAAFVSKFDSNGNYIWTRIVDSAGADQGLAIAFDFYINVYLAGYYTGTATIKDQTGATISTLPASTGNAVFVAKFMTDGGYQGIFVPDGGYQGTIIMDSAGSDQGLGVTCDSNYNMYISGYYTGTPTFRYEDGSPIFTLPASTTNAAFLSKFDYIGQHIWSRIVDSAGADQGLSVACDLNNNVYLAGYYTGTPTIKDQNNTTLGTLPASTNSAVFLSKFDTNGVYQWSRIVDSAGNDQGLGVTCDSSGNVYLAGHYTGTPTIKTETNQTLKSLPTATSESGFYIQFNSYGTYLYSRIVESNTSGSERFQDVVCDFNNNVCIAGFYLGTAIIKNDSNATLFTLPVSAGGSVAFVSKFSQFFSNVTVNEYPPTRLTANTFVVSGQSYGNGTYTLITSSESTATTGPYQAFDKSVSNVYQSAASRYSTTTPFANVVAASTVITNFGTIGGEWIDITLPNSIQLYGYQIQPTATIAAGPGTFFLCGHDGTSFQLVDRRSGYTWTSQSSVTFNVNIQTSYNRYRLVVPNLAGNAGNLQIAELRFFGT